MDVRVARFVRLAIGLTALFAFPSAPWAAEASCTSLQPAAAERGATVRVTIANTQAQRADVRLKSQFQALVEPTPIQAQAVGGLVTFVVPSLPLGDYLIDVTTDAATDNRCQARFQITPPSTARLRLYEFQPAGTYDFTRSKWLTERDGTTVERYTTNLRLRGTGFLTDIPSDNHILIDGHEIAVDWTHAGTSEGTCPPMGGEVTKTFGRVISEYQIQLCHVPFNRDFAQVSVMQHGVAVTTPAPFRLYRLHTARAALISAGLTLVLALFIVGLAYSYRLAQAPDRRSEYNVVKSLLLDMETETYSLSKFQFYVWTIAAIFGYIYLVISRMFVQGLSWPEMPGNVPAIIGIGAGTFVASQVVTNIRGPKGSGTERPNLGDLIMSGGVAAVDRVQMLLWTIVGAAIFCRAVLRYAPGEIVTLDAVPESLMYLMGLSSAGYLGGKFARKPGPVLNEISVTPSQSDVALAESALPPPDIVPSLTPYLEPARAVLKEVNGHAASQAAKTAVGKLATAVANIENVRTEESAVRVARELENAKQEAHEAASIAATEFAHSANAEAQTQAEIAQRAAAVLYDLAAALSQMLPRQLNRPPGAPAFTRTLELRGRNLSPEGLLQIDGMELPFRMLVPDPADAHGKRAPIVVVREPDVVGMAVVLRLNIDPAQLEPPDLVRYKKWFERDGAHTLRLINLDGQQDDLSFTIPPGSAQSEGKAGTAATHTGLKAAAAGAGT
jgi:hypothetical protein